MSTGEANDPTDVAEAGTAASAVPPTPAWLAPLLRTDRHPLLYIPIAAAISFVGSVLVSLALAAILPVMPTVEQDVGGAGAIASLVVVAPVVETLIMWPIVVLLSRLFAGRIVPIALVSAALWAAFHSVFEPIWGAQVLWPFFVFTVVFAAWRRARSARAAVLVTSAVHALQNAAGVLVLSLGMAG